MGIFDVFKSSSQCEDRKKRSQKFIKSLGISYNENLPVIESSSDVKLKSLDIICKRALGCLLSIQFACDVADNRDIGDSKAIFSPEIKKFKVE